MEGAGKIGHKYGGQQKSDVIAAHQKPALGAGEAELFLQRGDLRGHVD